MDDSDSSITSSISSAPSHKVGTVSVNSSTDTYDSDSSSISSCAQTRKVATKSITKSTENYDSDSYSSSTSSTLSLDYYDCEDDEASSTFKSVNNNEDSSTSGLTSNPFNIPGIPAHSSVNNDNSKYHTFIEKSTVEKFESNNNQLIHIKTEENDGCLKAWEGGEINYDECLHAKDNDKQALHKLLGIQDFVIEEFKVRTKRRKRKRGRPCKKINFLAPRPIAIVGEDTSKKNYQPSRKEVEEYLEELEVQVTSEKEGEEKKRGRPQKFDYERSSNMKIKKIKEEVFGPEVPIEPTLKTGLYNISNIQKKRGRPPKIKTEEELNRVPKKRGRPPKPKSAEDLLPKEKKKRGRPAKPKTAEDLLPKIPKKRGRKPKRELGSDDEKDDEYRPPGYTPKKPKMIYTFEKTADQPELNEEEIKEMAEKGLLVVDATDPSFTLPRGRGRPPKDFYPTIPNAVPEYAWSRNPEDKRPIGRPRKGFEKPKDSPKELKKRGRPKKENVETEEKILKKRGRKPKEYHERMRQENRVQHICVNDPKQVQNMKSKMKKPDYVPAYKPRSLYSCGFCQAWSWDLKVCSNCFRAVPPGVKILTVEEHEVMSDTSDRNRPYYHPPPIPYLKPGLVTFCPGCFYYSTKSDFCSECSYQLPRDSFSVYIDFEEKVAETPGVEMVPFRARFIDHDWMECPHCEFSCLRSGPCAHCGKDIPRNVTLVPDDPTKSWNLKWPTQEMLKSGFVPLPVKYVPTFKEGVVTMCRWCCTWVRDLNRCSKCHRKLPRSSDLLPDGPAYDYVDGVQAHRPKFSDPPLPYLRPGKMVICPDCGDYSKDMKNCDSCTKRLVNRNVVYVSFDRHDDSKPLEEGVKMLPFSPRKVDFLYVICPHCEFSTADLEKCTNCGKVIPQLVTVTSTVPDKKKKDEIGANKPASIFQARTTLAETIGGNKMTKKKKNKLPQNYVPRFRERGVAQCPSCQAWTWDFDRCSLCFAEVQKPGELPLIIYPKEAMRDKTVEAMRPRFGPAPFPYMRPGRVTMCKDCFCYTRGPPFCSECGKLMEQDPQYVTIDFEWGGDIESLPRGSEVLEYKPRMTADEKLALCPFCGYTTENPETCSFCNKNIPKLCPIMPENPMVYSFEHLLNHLKPKIDNKPKTSSLIKQNKLPIVKQTEEIIEIKTAKPIPTMIKKIKINTKDNIPIDKPVKVVALKPVPPPKIVPKNVVKINLPPTTGKLVTSKVVPLPPTNYDQIIFPHEVSSTNLPPKKRFRSDDEFLFPIVITGSMSSGKLQKALAAANLTGPKFVTSTPKSNSEIDFFNCNDGSEQVQIPSSIIPLVDLESPVKLVDLEEKVPFD